MRLRKLYLKFRYRKCGAAAVGIIKGNKNNDFQERLSAVEKEIVPCAKTNREVIDILKSMKRIEEYRLTDEEISEFKINYILNQRPELLSTPQLALPKGKMPTAKEMQNFTQNSNARFLEAKAYPFEKLGLILHAYSLKLELSDECEADVRIICEKNKDELYASAKIIDKQLSNEESEALMAALDDVTLLKGIREDDIKNKNARYLAYAAAYMKRRQ